LKILGDIRSSRCTTGVFDTGGIWKKLQSEKFYRAVSNFFGKFSKIFAAQGAPLVSLTPVAYGKNLNQKSFTDPIIYHQCR
jgi:hypothetical protein